MKKQQKKYQLIDNVFKLKLIVNMKYLLYSSILLVILSLFGCPAVPEKAEVYFVYPFWPPTSEYTEYNKTFYRLFPQYGFKTIVYEKEYLKELKKNVISIEDSCTKTCFLEAYVKINIFKNSNEVDSLFVGYYNKPLIVYNNKYFYHDSNIFDWLHNILVYKKANEEIIYCKYPESEFRLQNCIKRLDKEYSKTLKENYHPFILSDTVFNINQTYSIYPYFYLSDTTKISYWQPIVSFVQNHSELFFELQVHAFPSGDSLLDLSKTDSITSYLSDFLKNNNIEKQITIKSYGSNQPFIAIIDYNRYLIKDDTLNYEFVSKYPIEIQKKLKKYGDRAYLKIIDIKK